jgi:hypothetical protein
MICILNIFLDIHTVTICILYTYYIIYTQKENMYIHIYICIHICNGSQVTDRLCAHRTWWDQRTTCHPKKRLFEMMIPHWSAVRKGHGSDGCSSLATQALWQLPIFWLPRFGYCGVRQRTAGVGVSKLSWIWDSRFSKYASPASPGETSGCPLVIKHG